MLGDEPRLASVPPELALLFAGQDCVPAVAGAVAPGPPFVFEP